MTFNVIRHSGKYADRHFGVTNYRAGFPNNATASQIDASAGWHFSKKILPCRLDY